MGGWKIRRRQQQFTGGHSVADGIRQLLRFVSLVPRLLFREVRGTVQAHQNEWPRMDSASNLLAGGVECGEYYVGS